MDRSLRQSPSYKYLGSVTADEGSKLEILSRIAQTTAALTRLSQCHRWFDFVCGIPRAHSRAEERPEITEEQRREFLRESPRWSVFLNVHAAIAMTVMAFLTGYYH